MEHEYGIYWIPKGLVDKFDDMQIAVFFESRQDNAGCRNCDGARRKSGELTHVLLCIKAEKANKQKRASYTNSLFCGMDETRTRDLLRDRQAF